MLSEISKCKIIFLIFKIILSMIVMIIIKTVFINNVGREIMLAVIMIVTCWTSLGS